MHPIKIYQTIGGANPHFIMGRSENAIYIRFGQIIAFIINPKNQRLLRKNCLQKQMANEDKK